MILCAVVGVVAVICAVVILCVVCVRTPADQEGVYETDRAQMRYLGGRGRGS